MKKTNEEQNLRLMAEAIPILHYATETYYDRECEAAKNIEDLIARIKQVLDEAGIPYLPNSGAYNPWYDPDTDPYAEPKQCEDSGWILL
jgi:hypothetical protein